MKKILGLDLGTNSIGWALVNEAENESEKSSIIKLGVRVNPLTVDEQSNFEKGKPITTNAGRTIKRGMRRNMQRYKLRRDNLIELLKEEGWIDDSTILAEQGPKSTFQTLHLRAKAVEDQISLEDLARVLLMINKKRGYKSNRKADKSSEKDGTLIDGMAVARELNETGLTPGQFVFDRMQNGKYSVPDFYRSDLEAEFNKIWDFQRQFHPDQLTDDLRKSLDGKNGSQVWTICKDKLKIVGPGRLAKGKKEQLVENYSWRNEALKSRLDLEQLVVVFQEIAKQLAESSGYLGRISDRSKELYFNHETVGQYLVRQYSANPSYSSRNVVFYRQDYIEEFDRIWDTQSKFHPELTDELKKRIKDLTIFYQRPLKSQKSLINICEFEHREVRYVVDGVEKMKTAGPRVCPKSSPLFQEFRIWQYLNNLTVDGVPMPFADRKKLFDELSWSGKMTKASALKLLYGAAGKDKEMNYKELVANTTLSTLFKTYLKILETRGAEVGGYDKISKPEALKRLKTAFEAYGWDSGLLDYDGVSEADNVENHPIYRLWHLLYSYEGDKSAIGYASLIQKLNVHFGFDEDAAKLLAKVTFEPDYGNLSAKAIKKILPYMKNEGLKYSEACEKAGYRHSAKSLTREEIQNRILKDRLENLPKNSLRNPVVEKILNQMVNVVNAVVDEYGKIDEVRIELARELKKSAEERDRMTKAMGKSATENEDIRMQIIHDFHIAEPSKNDILRYRLYKELEQNGYKTLYSNTYIPYEKILDKEFEIEHIIPQALLFDDSFSNKTLEAHSHNLNKGKKTAMDYVTEIYGEKGSEAYRATVNKLLAGKCISKTKANHLLWRECDIPSGFINRDLKDTQYIARKAKEMLEEIVPYVVSTTGSVTDRLREDWQLVDVMRELNWDKYEALGLTRYKVDRDGRKIPKIENWTKRNDHRHHAMDALTIAFTKRAFIQYLNYLNARLQQANEPESDFHIDLSDYELDDLSALEPVRLNQVLRAIEKKCTYRDEKKRLRFKSPIPLDEFRAEALKHLDSALVSIKSKNKVVTRNVNVSKKSGGKNKKVQLTPRGQLHEETVYGRINQYELKEEKVGPSFTAEKISRVSKKLYRESLLRRLEEFGGDPKRAFGGKNSLEKNPLWVDESHSSAVPLKVALLSVKENFVIRKLVDGSFKQDKIDKVVDRGIREVLTARLKEFDGEPTKAFTNLDANPIWLNKEKGIAVKRVRILVGGDMIPLHEKHDNVGDTILNNDNKIPDDYVATGSNHHIAIYQDSDGNLHENVVSFFEATARATIGLPVVDSEYRKDEGWAFMFTMKQNEYFVFPNPKTGFDPNEIDLKNPENYPLISPNLFRVQKLSSGDYWFRHHLETQVDSSAKELRNVTWKRISINALRGIVKVRVNHIGEIVAVGEY